MSTPRRPRRLIAACHRCHSHKIKCSGDRPCNSCVASDKAEQCQFPAKERKVTISESYLRRLEADSKRLQSVTQNPSPESQQQHQQHTPGYTQDQDAPPLSAEESSMLNPLFDGQPETPPGVYGGGGQVSEPSFIGEASCAAFSNRLMQCLDDNSKPSTAGFSNYYRLDTPPPQHRIAVPDHASSSSSGGGGYYGLPERMHAKLLLNVARRFIGNYHPLFLEVTFMRELDAVYRRDMMPSVLWLCKFYALMALGEIYTNRRGVGDSNRVPGTDYYVRSVGLLQESFEEPCLMQVETLTLLAWTSNILGRVRTAYAYSGMAMRLALSMGMHRSAASLHPLTPVEKESRRRTWWVLYFFDRFSASKLGQPIMIRDEDIDVEFPSMDGLTEDERAEFLDPMPLVTNTKLARIIGNILTDIYGIPKRTSGLCIHRVHGILKQLRAWHDELPPELRVQEYGTPRPVASLHLAYNQCIIQTTRPVLLHLFKTQFHLGPVKLQRSDQDQDQKQEAQQQQQQQQQQQRRQGPSPITLALAESCVSAAQASSRVVEGLFLDGAIATFGYWDAHHVFSAALVLLMSAVMKPAPAPATTTTTTATSLETLLSILRSMKDNGNIPAVDFCARLSHIQERIADLRGAEREGKTAGSEVMEERGGRQASSGTTTTAAGARGGDPSLGVTTISGSSGGVGGGGGAGNSNQGHAAGGGGGMGYSSFDILNNPLMGSFLDETRAPWPDSLFREDGTLQEFASEIEEQFLFHM